MKRGGIRPVPLTERASNSRSSSPPVDSMSALAISVSSSKEMEMVDSMSSLSISVSSSNEIKVPSKPPHQLQKSLKPKPKPASTPSTARQTQTQSREQKREIKSNKSPQLENAAPTSSHIRALQESDADDSVPATPALVIPVSHTFDKYFEYFNNLEKWLQLAMTAYQRYPEKLQDEEQIVSSVVRQLFQCAGYMFHLNNPAFIQYKIEKEVWLSVYEIISMLRQSRKACVNSEFGANIIGWAIKYFEELLDDLQTKCDVDMKPLIAGRQYFEDSFHPRSNADRHVRNLRGDFDHAFPLTSMAEIIYRVFIYLGDLGRYGAKMHPFFIGKAVTYYNAARMFANNKGRGFYQLGVLFLANDDYMQALYNFLRAFAAENPVEEAKLQIDEVYDRAFKKHLSVKNDYWFALSKYKEKLHHGKLNHRESWVFPENGKLPPLPAVHEPPPTKKQHIASLSTREIYNRFSLTYALVWGKLRGRIGLDDLNEVAEESLIYFEALLERNGITSLERMIQVVILAIKVADEVIKTQHEHERAEDVHFIMQYVLEHFSILAERLLNLLNLHDWDNPSCQFISSAMVLWVGWLDVQDNTWKNQDCPRPRFSIRRVEKSVYVNKKDKTDDRWIVIADLQTRIESLFITGDENPTIPVIFPEIHLPVYQFCPNDDFNVSFTLLERFYLRGFGEIPYFDQIHTEHPNYYCVRSEHDVMRAKLALKLQKIQSWGCYLRYSDPELMNATPSSLGEWCVYTGLAQFRASPKSLRDSCGLNEDNYLYWASDEPHKVPKKNVVTATPNKSKGDSNEARVILKSKCAVDKAKSYEEKSNFNKWRVLKEKGFRTELIIIPSRLVMDTNCFVNKMDWVEKLVKFAAAPILVPVTVVLELKGLSRGGIRPKHREKYDDRETDEAQELVREGNDTAELSKSAMNFINKNLKCFSVVTTTGRILPILSLSEKVNDDHFDPKQRNDNRILDTCRTLEEEDTELRKRNTPFRLLRRTVLVTNDRGLHVKSKANGIPAVEIESIVSWMAAIRKKKEGSGLTQPSASTSTAPPTQPLTGKKQRNT